MEQAAGPGRLRRAIQAFEGFLTDERVRRYLVIGGSLWLAILLYVLSAGHLPRDAYGNLVGGDFAAHFIGGRFALRGEWSHLYDFPYQEAAQHAEIPDVPADFHNAYISPPVTAYLYAPFAKLSFLRAYGAWVAFSMLLTVASARVLRPLLPEALYQSTNARLTLFLCAPFVETCYAGQDAAVSLFLFCVGTRLLHDRRDLYAGLVFGLGMFKPQLFLLVPVMLLARKRFVALGTFVLASALMALVSLSLIGRAGLTQYLAALSSDVYRVRIAAAMNWKMISLPALARGLLPHGAEPVIRPLSALLALGLVAFYGRAVWALRKEDELYAFALAPLGAVVVSPHAFAYDGLVLALPVAFMVGRVAVGLRAALALGFSTFWFMPALDSLAKSMHARCPPLSSLGVLSLGILAGLSLSRLAAQAKSGSGAPAA